MTIANAHRLYMGAMERGDRRKLKPRTIDDKKAIYKRDIGPRLVIPKEPGNDKLRVMKSMKDDRQEGSRRRGKVLENAILEAAWAELTEGGYSRFTLQSVAKRAGTSRPVLHRRWRSRTDLAAAAMTRHFASHPVNVPDLGNVRDELALLLRQLADRGTPVVLRLALAMSEDLAREGINIAALRSRIVEAGALDEILQRGIDRGEIDPRRITPQIASLPKDLLRHEAIMTNDDISDDFILAVLDQIFLPLVSSVRQKPTTA